MIDDQTREDLESLLAEVDNGWCAYNDFDFQDVAISFGIGGCLVEEMHRVLFGNEIIDFTLSPERYFEFMRRQSALVKALGFHSNNAMFAWNDAQRDPDVIKHRIKDALNEAVAVADVDRAP